MAYNADIIVRLVETEVDKAVKSIERKLQGLQDTANNVEISAVTKGTRELKGFEKRVDAINRSLERIKPTAAIGGISAALAAGAGGAEKLAEALQGINNLGPLFGKITPAVNSFGSSLEQAVGPAGKLGAALIDFVASAPASAAGIGLATASLFAFAPAIKQATTDIFSFKKNLQNLVTSITADSLVAFDSLNEKFELTRKGLIELAKGTGSLSFLKQELKEARKSLDEMDSTAEEFRQETVRLIEAEKNVNNELRERKRIYDELTAQQRRVRENVEASRASRAGTGFGASDPVAKSIRRNQEKVAREKARLEKLSATAQAPLALPSSDMLKAAERGIKNLKAVSNQLGKDLDFVNQRSRNFTDSINAAAAKGQQLPGIFGQLGKVLEKSQQITTRNAAVNNNVNQIIKSRLLLSSLVNEGLESQVRAESEALDQARRRLFIEQEIADVAAEAAKLKQNQAKSQRPGGDVGRLRENLLLGAGFPLLFGGGAGAVGGGVLGSLAGDGFGGQIFFSALGTALDGFAESTANLGAELNKAVPDVDKITERLGVVGTGTEAYIRALQDSDQATRAAEAATDELAQLVGQDGVRALKEFGAQTTELGNELAKAFTLMAAAAAKIISGSSAFKEIETQLPRAVAFQQAKNSDNPEIQKLFSELEGTNAFAPGGSARRAELGDEIIEKQLELNRLREEGNRIAAEGIAIVANEKELAIESAELVNLRKLALAAEGDQRLTLLAQVEEQVEREALLAEKAELLNRAKLGEISYRAVALALQEKQVKLDERLREIREGLAKDLADGSSSGSSGVDKEAQAQKAMAVELTKQFELETKIAAIGQTKIQKINTELDSLDKKKALKIKELELSTEDARVLAAKLKTLDLETDALRKQLELQAARLQLEEKLADLKGEQTLGNLQRDLDQELASLTLPTGDAFEDERTQLALEQQQRYADVMAGVNDQIAQQHLLIAEGDAETAKSARAKLKLLEREKGIYEKMLPAIAAAEQQQLKFNQVLSMVEGPVNAFVGSLTQGLQGIIDGTMSAEEAFSNMLKNMGQALIDTAAQMIAQYIAIGIARAFAGMGSDSAESMFPMDTGGWTLPEGATPITSSSWMKRANGGPVKPNGTYLVGEQGPELLTMGTQSGFVHSNTSEAMDRYRAGRSGGGGGGSLDVSYNVTQINGMNFVTEEQFRAGMSRAAKDGAKMGEAGTFKSMKNSRSNRRRVGI